jgi:UrcA family protein
MFTHLNTLRNRAVAVAATLATLAVLAAAPAALAGTAVDAAAEQLPQRVVPAADLDLSTAEGVATLYRRLDAAATSVCPAADRELLRTQIAHNCRLRVLDEVINRVALPSLTALHRDRSGRVTDRYASR